jgi:hypothetical protein
MQLLGMIDGKPEPDGMLLVAVRDAFREADKSVCS